MADIINFMCVSCHARLKAKPQAAGSLVGCPRCQQKMWVPEVGEPGHGERGARANDSERAVEVPARLRFPCPKCGRRLAVSATRAGQQLPCPACAAACQVPFLDAADQQRLERLALQGRSYELGNELEALGARALPFLVDKLVSRGEVEIRRELREMLLRYEPRSRADSEVAAHVGRVVLAVFNGEHSGFSENWFCEALIPLLGKLGTPAAVASLGRILEHRCPDYPEGKEDCKIRQADRRFPCDRLFAYVSRPCYRLMDLSLDALDRIGDPSAVPYLRRLVETERGWSDFGPAKQFSELLTKAYRQLGRFSCADGLVYLLAALERAADGYENDSRHVGPADRAEALKWFHPKNRFGGFRCEILDGIAGAGGTEVIAPLLAVARRMPIWTSEILRAVRQVLERNLSVLESTVRDTLAEMLASLLAIAKQVPERADAALQEVCQVLERNARSVPDEVLREIVELPRLRYVLHEGGREVYTPFGEYWGTVGVQEIEKVVDTTAVRGLAAAELRSRARGGGLK